MESFSSDPSTEPITPPDYPSHDPSSMPLDYWDSPPSPPQSLPDRMQLAYAHGDMHLARVLLLKMQGIEVDGDDDPRIAAVREEDFRCYFVPDGTFQFEEAELRIFEEGERIERERRRRIARQERLKSCGILWEESVQAVRYEKAQAERRREDEMIRRRRSEIEAREREKLREREQSREKDREMQRLLKPLRTSSGNSRTLLCYDSLLDKRTAKPSPSQEDLFQYPLPPSPPRVSSSYLRNSSLPKQDSLSLTRFKRELALQHSRSIARSVSFADVIISMHGPLFPTDETSSGKAQKNRSAAQIELFQSLLQTTAESGEQEQVVVQGKDGNAASADERSDTDNRKQGPEQCVAKSQSSQSSVKTISDSALSTSASTITRTTSWFSFGSRRSSSTVLTTPSTSVSSTSAKSPPPPSATLPSVIIPSTTIGRSVPGRISPPTLVPASDDPLSPPPPPTHQLSQPSEGPSDPNPSRGRPLTRGGHAHASSADGAATGSDLTSDRGLVLRVSRSVTTIMDLAAQLQRAYVKATLFSVGADMYAYTRSRSSSRGPSSSRSRTTSPVRHRHSSSLTRSNKKRKLQPEGYRVHPSDVAVFISPLLADDDISPSSSPNQSWQSGTRTVISLVNASDFHDLNTVRTYQRVFPVPPPIPRSPFRFPEPPPVQIARPRPVANPLILRLQALQNICTVRSLTWEGRPREGKMCAGKERMTGVAWEGIGRSSLNWEIRPASVY